MNFESQPKRSKEDIADFEKTRTISDAKLLKNGAKYIIGNDKEKRLEVTPEQIEFAKGEMLQERSFEKYQGRVHDYYKEKWSRERTVTSPEGAVGFRINTEKK